ncbi:MAG: hypothetical protein KDI69_02380 [Xanthomonadales bacterium]|nr:hypothetical protein [Xanthomonadales bacterium]
MKTNDIRDLLETLPDAPLPDTLLPRLQQRHRRRRALNRVQAVAAVLVVGFGLWTLIPRDVPLQVRTPAVIAQNLASPAEIEVVDRALQAAYAEGASNDELAPLWALRGRLIANTATH